MSEPSRNQSAPVASAAPPTVVIAPTSWAWHGWRLLALCGLALLAGVICDRLRNDRVLFRPPLPALVLESN